MAHLDAYLTGDQEVEGPIPAESGIFFHKIDNEIFSTFIHSLSLI